MNSSFSFVNRKFVSVQHFPPSKPNLTTSNSQLVSNLKNVMDESSVLPTTSPPSADSPTITVLSGYLSQKEMETLHSSIDSRSSLTVAATKSKYFRVSSKYHTKWY